MTKMIIGFQLSWEGDKFPRGAYLVDTRDDCRQTIIGLQSGCIHTDKGILSRGTYERIITYGIFEVSGNRSCDVSSRHQKVFIEVPEYFQLYDLNGIACKQFATLTELYSKLENYEAENSQ